MKYRELSPNEIEAYNVGYKVGNRQIVITDIEWESENEHKIYRKGYMAGLMDYKRKVSNVDNVSNVSNVEIATPTTSITSTTPIGISISNSISKKNISIDTKFNAGFQGWKFEPALLSVAKKHWTAETIRKIEIDFSCQEYNTETSVQELLERYPADKDKGLLPKDLGQYENLRPQMQKWVDYKKSRGEKYKSEQSLLVCAKKLHELSGGNALNADAIVEQSIANNYAGLFPLKNTQQKRKPNINLDACEDNFLNPNAAWWLDKKE